MITSVALQWNACLDYYVELHHKIIVTTIAQIIPIHSEQRANLEHMKMYAKTTTYVINNVSDTQQDT